MWNIVIKFIIVNSIIFSLNINISNIMSSNDVNFKVATFSGHTEIISVICFSNASQYVFSETTDATLI